MDLEKNFKNLIWFSLLSLIFVIITGSEVEPQVYLNHTFMILSLAYTVGYLISLYMLYKFIKFGKTLFIAMIILAVIGTLGLPPTILSPLASVAYYFGAMADGAILVMLYVTDIKDKFA